MKRIKMVPMLSIAGKPFKIAKDEDGNPQEQASLKTLILLLIYNLPPPKITMKDSIEAQRTVEQIRNSKEGWIELEDAEHDWVKDTIEKNATMVFGVNAVQLKDAWDKFERLHEPKEKDKNGS